MDSLLKFAAATCLFIFGTIFLLTFKMPKAIEQSTESFIKTQIESEIIELVFKEQASSVLGYTLQLGKKMGLKTDPDKLQERLEAVLPKLIEYIVYYKTQGNPKGYSFEKLAQSSADFVQKFKFGEQKLEALIEEKYEEINKNLKQDIRIFSGVNTLLFLFLLFLFYQGKYLRELRLPSFLLFASTILSSLLYIFGQDWIYVLMYNNYLGFSYLIYIGIIFCLLLDIVYNQGQITLRIIELFLEFLKNIGELATI